MRDEPQLRLCGVEVDGDEGRLRARAFRLASPADALAVETTVRGNDALMVKYVEKSM